MLGIICAPSTGAGNFGYGLSNMLDIALRKKRVNFMQGIKIVCNTDKIGVLSPIKESPINSIGSNSFSNIADIDVARRSNSYSNKMFTILF